MRSGVRSLFNRFRTCSDVCDKVKWNNAKADFRKDCRLEVHRRPVEAWRGHAEPLEYTSGRRDLRTWRWPFPLLCCYLSPLNNFNFMPCFQLHTLRFVDSEGIKFRTSMSAWTKAMELLLSMLINVNVLVAISFRSPHTLLIDRMKAY